MRVTVLASPGAPEAAEFWVGLVFVKDWTELGSLLEAMSAEFSKVLLRNEHGSISLEILS